MKIFFAIVLAFLLFCVCVFFIAISKSITEEELHKQIDNNKKNGKKETYKRATTKEN